MRSETLVLSMAQLVLLLLGEEAHRAMLYRDPFAYQ